MQYVGTEVQRMGIEDYEKANRMLALHLFSDIELTDDEKEMLDYILCSGTYGTFENRIKNQIEKDGGKIQYVTRRLLGPRNNERERKHFQEYYSVFYRHKFLLPFLPVYRLSKAVVMSPKRIPREIRSIRKKKKNSNVSDQLK